MYDTFFADRRESDNVTVGFALYGTGFLSARSRNSSSVDVVNEYWPATGDLTRRGWSGLKHLLTERAINLKYDEVMPFVVLELTLVQIPQTHVGSCCPISNAVRLQLACQRNQIIDLEITVGKDLTTGNENLLGLNLVGSDASKIKREFHLL